MTALRFAERTSEVPIFAPRQLATLCNLVAPEGDHLLVLPCQPCVCDTGIRMRSDHSTTR